MNYKRIYIITINDNANYGNRLQNYALTSLLNSDNLLCQTLIISPKISNLKEAIKYVYYNYPITIPFYSKFSFLSNKYFMKISRLKESIKFTRRFIPSKRHFSKIYTSEQYSRNFVIIGSDQVWNYQCISKEMLALRLGSFVPDNVPIISYAASFGVSEVSNDVKPIFQKYLPRFKAISVREDQGKELIRNIAGLNAIVVLDPTLMLDSSQWNNITRGFVSDNDKYVLTYFLGKPSDEQEQAIQDYAKAHGCRVRRILDLRDKETYVAGPQDFVELFSKAQYVFTDSYHACCFSILYHKQFTVFNRAGMEGKASMNSRMETLFRLFDLDSVVMDKGLAPRIDYDKVDKLLAQHRAESQTWLDKAMEA